MCLGASRFGEAIKHLLARARPKHESHDVQTCGTASFARARARLTRRTVRSRPRRAGNAANAPAGHGGREAGGGPDSGGRGSVSVVDVEISSGGW